MYDTRTLGIEAIPPADTFKHIQHARRMNFIAAWLLRNAGNIACGIGIALCFAYLLGLPEFHW